MADDKLDDFNKKLTGFQIQDDLIADTIKIKSDKRDARDKR